MSDSVNDGLKIFAFVLAVGMILGGIAMVLSKDWITKVEGWILAPTLIVSGVAIIIELIKSGA